MIKKGYVPYAEYQKHIRGPWQTVHKLWPHIRNYVPGWGYSKTEIDAFFEGEDGGKKQVDWARITSKPGTFPPSAHTLASHSTKAHSELSDAPADAHHPQSHTLASHSTKAHSELSDAPADAHHAQLHAASHIFEAGDELNHDDLAGFVAAKHLSLPNTMAAVLSSYLLDDLSNTAIGTPPNGSLLQYWTSDSKWHDVVDLPPAAHASSHHVAGSDLVNHDSLTGFVGAEHLSLPNSMANVINSGHTKAIHDALDIEAANTFAIDGVEVVSPTPTNGYVLTYVSANTRWEDKPPGAGAHAATHEVGGGDLVDHDALTGYLAAEHKSLPRTFADVINAGHDAALHNALALNHANLSNVAVDQHHLEDHTLLSHTTRPHSALTDVSSDQHHAQAHTLTSHSTKAHSELSDAPADAHHARYHASAHHVAGGDLVNHDSLTGFVAAEHVSLPNTVANVLSNHTKTLHDSLDLSAAEIDGVTVVATTPTNGYVLTYVSANSRWEDKPIGGSVALGDLSDVTIGAPENADLLQYWTSDSKWHNVADIPPIDHAASHHVGGGDLVNHDSLTGFVAAEHKSLPNTIAQVLSNHTTAVHDALSINAHRLDGYHGASLSTVNTFALRDASGDIHARLFRSEYDSLNATCNIFMTQIDTASNNYIRPSTRAQVIASLRTQTWAFTGMVTARDHGTGLTDEIVNICYGTGNPPAANTTTIGTLFVKYTA